MSVATTSAVLRVRLTRTMSRGAAAGDRDHGAGAADIAGPDNTDFHDISVAWPINAPMIGSFRERSLPWNAGSLEQEPGAPLGFVDPVLDQAGGCHVVMLVAKRVRLAQTRHQLLVVVAQLR